MSIPLLTWLAFIGAFALIVLLHEGGHFFVARLVGIEIEEFGFGLPPRLLRLWRSRGWLRVGGKRLEIPPNFNLPFDPQAAIGHMVIALASPQGERWVLKQITLPEDQDEAAFHERGERQSENGDWKIVEVLHEIHLGTEYTLNWLPLGGFVRPKGENNPNIPGGLAAATPGKRLAVLFAGPLMNLLLGVLVYSLIFMQSGIPRPEVYIKEVAPDSPALAAGLQVGDRLAFINGQKIETTTQARRIIYAQLDQPVQIIVERQGQQLTLTAVPSSARPPEQGALGILMTQPYARPASWFHALPYATRATYAYIRQFLTLPALWLRGQLSAEEGRLIGLRGIFDFFSQAVERDVTQSQSAPTTPGSTAPLPPPSYTLALIASLTITIGLFNIFPIPALDGGRILFVLAEVAFRRRIPPELETKIHAIGFALLLLLMIYVNLMDFINPIQP